MRLAHASARELPVPKRAMFFNIRRTRSPSPALTTAGYTKIDEIPYDFTRKRLSVIVSDKQGTRTLITKGAMANVLQVCSSVLSAGSSSPLDHAKLTELDERFRKWSGQGFRVLAVATKPIATRNESYSRDDEKELEFEGFLLFFDPPKADAAKAISDLAERGVQLKMITGDNQLVARHVAESVNLPMDGVLTGADLNAMGDEALWFPSTLRAATKTARCSVSRSNTRSPIRPSGESYFFNIV